MRPKLIFSPAQVRAGRALRALTVEQLADLSRLEAEAIELYERGEGDLAPAEHAALGEALYADGAGVIAIPANCAGEGVRFARLPELQGTAGLGFAGLPPSTLKGRGHGDW